MVRRPCEVKYFVCVRLEGVDAFYVVSPVEQRNNLRSIGQLLGAVRGKKTILHYPHRQ